jgi:hypothetical protein
MTVMVLKISALDFLITFQKISRGPEDDEEAVSRILIDSMALNCSLIVWKMKLFLLSVLNMHTERVSIKKEGQKARKCMSNILAFRYLHITIDQKFICTR